MLVVCAVVCAAHGQCCDSLRHSLDLFVRARPNRKSIHFESASTTFVGRCDQRACRSRTSQFEQNFKWSVLHLNFRLKRHTLRSPPTCSTDEVQIGFLADLSPEFFSALRSSSFSLPVSLGDHVQKTSFTVPLNPLNTTKSR